MEKLKLNLFEIILGLSEALDLVSPNVANHHKRVAYIAGAIGKKIGLPENIQRRLVLAGSVHDIGGLTAEERLSALKFEDELTREHAEIGYSLLTIFDPLKPVAEIVRYHHLPWNYGKGSVHYDNQVPNEAHIVHLADRISVLINDSNSVLESAPGICERIAAKKGSSFMPEYVDAFLELAQKESFWLDIVSNSLDKKLSKQFENVSLELSLIELVAFSRIFSRIVDFRSPVNAAHSSGVASSAELLSRKLGFDETKSTLMLIAGYFHDLGKLAVPPAILEKPAKLTKEEYLTIKKHTYYTYSILDNIKAFEDIKKWAAFHHEKLDGTGYPFHLKAKDLPFESQVMSVADVFTAVTEDRPYRPGMKKEEVVKLLNNMVNNNALNGDIVSVLIQNYDEINHGRTVRQNKSLEEYRLFIAPISRLTALK